MTTRNRVAHTASFLQTFHTGQTTAARRADAGAEGSEPKAAPADAAAVAFVRGQKAATFAQPVASDSALVDVLGWKVRQGAGLLTEPQARYVVGIAQTREGVTDEMLESLRIRLEQGFAKYAASQFITKYKDLPRKAKPVSAAGMEAISPTQETPAPAHKVGKGHYAVTLHGEDKLRFFRVNPGHTVVFVDEQASDERYPVRDRTRRQLILATIAENPEAAMARYGQEIGSCGRCNRTLTDETSRARGIGPDCWSKM